MQCGEGRVQQAEGRADITPPREEAGRNIGEKYGRKQKRERDNNHLYLYCPHRSGRAKRTLPTARTLASDFMSVRAASGWPFFREISKAV